MQEKKTVKKRRVARVSHRGEWTEESKESEERDR